MKGEKTEGIRKKKELRVPRREGRERALRMKK